MSQVIAKLEGPAVSQYCALRLLQVDVCSRLLPLEVLLLLLSVYLHVVSYKGSQPYAGNT